MKGSLVTRLSSGPDGIISELLRDATSTEREVILHWLNEVLASDEPGLRISMKEVHGPVTLMHKGGDPDSTDRASSVVLLNSCSRCYHISSKSVW